MIETTGVKKPGKEEEEINSKTQKNTEQNETRQLE
jgi:hypothetical protein